MFALRKWYLDVVTEDGAAAILYAARLGWGPLRAAYSSMLLATPDAPPRERAARGRVEWPRDETDTIRWEHHSFRVRGEWVRNADAIERTLAEYPEGAVQWSCRMPCARASVDIGDTHLEGLGYVECLDLSIVPWKLPFHRLRWGRYTSPRHSAVWIAWEGGDERRWVWLDGTDQPSASINDGLSGLEDGGALVLEAGRTLRDRGLIPAIRGPLPALARRVAGPLGRMHECKSLARGVMTSTSWSPDHGWSIYEVVSW